MKTVLSTLALLIVVISPMRATEPAALPDYGPQDGGLCMRLVVAPQPDPSEEGFEVRVDLLNTSQRDRTLRTGWRDDDAGDLKDYIAAATSIECVPAVLPWSGGVPERGRNLPQPELLLKAGEVLSVQWQTEGRHLKNRVTDPNEVQNPTFPLPGLYSVHARLDVVTSDGIVSLRSNEQLVSVGGSRAMPKYTFGRLSEVDAGGKSAVLQLGSRHKVEPGDQFEHFSKQTPWKLTIVKVAPGHCWGHIEMLSTNSVAPPRPGMGATLIMKE